MFPRYYNLFVVEPLSEACAVGLLFSIFVAVAGRLQCSCTGKGIVPVGTMKQVRIRYNKNRIFKTIVSA